MDLCGPRGRPHRDVLGARRHHGRVRSRGGIGQRQRGDNHSSLRFPDFAATHRIAADAGNRNVRTELMSASAKVAETGRTVLGAPGGEIPPGDSTVASDRHAADAPAMSASPPIASELWHRSEMTRCANRDLTRRSKQSSIRSPRRRKCRAAAGSRRRARRPSCG